MAGRAGESITVLHIDDEPGITELTAEFLQREDEQLEVLTEMSARDGLERYDEEVIDCIVCDYQMPEMDGLAVLEVLRDDRDSEVPFIMFTGKGHEEVAMKALNMGADRYLQKGGDPRTQYGVLARVIRQTVEHHRLAKANRTAEERYRSLFENNPLAIWEEDFSKSKRFLDSIAEGVDDLTAYFDDHPDEVWSLIEMMDIIDVNQNALDYYEASSKAELLENLERLFTDEAYEANKSMWVNIADGKTSFREETVSRTLSGERKHEIMDLNVPDEHAEDYSRVYLTVADITERKQRQRELQRQKDRLEEFASVVSHDLRNPLTVAQGRLDLLSGESESEHLDHISRSLDRIEEIIEDTLTLAKQGQTVGERERTAIVPLLEQCWKDAGTVDATLEIVEEPTIRGDPGRLRHLFENLVWNAVEHGGEGVTVRFGLLEEGGFYLEDDGPGIPEDERESVMKAGHSTADGGTGFGLSIVNRIAEAHGWQVTITDGTDGGARFECTGVEILS